MTNVTLMGKRRGARELEREMAQQFGAFVACPGSYSEKAGLDHSCGWKRKSLFKLPRLSLKGQKGRENLCQL